MLNFVKIHQKDKYSILYNTAASDVKIHGNLKYTAQYRGHARTLDKTSRILCTPGTYKADFKQE